MELNSTKWLLLKRNSLKPSWSTWWNPISTKNIKISQAWWCIPVIPATRKTEAGVWLEPRRQKLRWAEFVPLQPRWHSKTPSQKKKKKKIINLAYHPQSVSAVGSAEVQEHPSVKCMALYTQAHMQGWQLNPEFQSHLPPAMCADAALGFWFLPALSLLHKLTKVGGSLWQMSSAEGLLL